MKGAPDGAELRVRRRNPDPGCANESAGDGFTTSGNDPSARLIVMTSRDWSRGVDAACPAKTSELQQGPRSIVGSPEPVEASAPWHEGQIGPASAMP